jgi:hypothetical protein
MARATVLRLGGLAAAVFVLAGAATGTAATNQPDLSTPTAIAAYLQSIGVNPATVTWEQGVNNYAGPNCPGIGWTCTTAGNVVQIAPPGGTNSVECGGPCTIVQSTSANGNNHAKCEEHSTDPAAVQDCTITQSGTSNDATVIQDVNATGVDNTGDQNVKQTAEVTQTSSGDNHSDVHQSVSESLTFGATQQQDAYQAANVSQTSDGNANFSHVHQTQDQSASGGTTQLQNTLPGTDCSTDPQKPANPNQCSDVSQDAGSGGINGAQLDQAIGERQTTTALAATQTQGQDGGGQKGVHDQTNPVGVGTNMYAAHIDLAQRQAGGAFQTQTTDPGCCGVSQTGGARISSNIDESTTQSATSGDAAMQSSELSGIVHQDTTIPDAPITAAAPSNTTNQTCSIDQHGRNNSGSGNFSVSETGPACGLLTLDTVCTSGPTPDAPVNSQPASPACGPPIEFEGVAGLGLPALVTLASTPTFGQDISMPDYSTPPDYLADIGG